MGTKNNPGKFDCYANALPDEPMFILLGRDPSAPSKVRAWAEDRQTDIRLGKRPETDMSAVTDARQCADDMERWRDQNNGAWRQVSKPHGVETMLKPEAVQWVVNDSAELGVKIGDQFFWFYRGSSLIYASGVHDNGLTMHWRLAGCHEFGPACRPTRFYEPGSTIPDQYRDGDGWMPLPAVRP